AARKGNWNEPSATSGGGPTVIIRDGVVVERQPAPEPMVGPGRGAQDHLHPHERVEPVRGASEKTPAAWCSEPYCTHPSHARPAGAHEARERARRAREDEARGGKAHCQMCNTADPEVAYYQCPSVPKRERERRLAGGNYPGGNRGSCELTRAPD